MFLEILFEPETKFRVESVGPDPKVHDGTRIVVNVLDTPPVLEDDVRNFAKMCEVSRDNENSFSRKPALTQSFPPKLPQNWIALVYPKTGRTYYANVVTKTTQWEFPQEPQP